MRKKYLPFIAIAIMTFFVACSNEDFITEENTDPQVEGRTISLTASIPDEEPATRVTLIEDGKNIAVTWTTDDRIDLVFVKAGQAMVRQRPQVTSVSNNGKTAHFAIVIPNNFTGEFTLYGVHGGRGTSTTAGSENLALLPTNPGSTSTLGSLQTPTDNRKMMLYFKHVMQATDTDASVSFQHLGSLFAISFNNTVNPSPTAGVTGARLVGVDASGVPLEEGKWAFNNGLGGQVFDLITEQFEDISTAGNYISFSTAGTTWAVEQTTTLWGWYPPIPNQAWPALRLVMTNSSDGEVLSSANFKSARETPPEAGKVYHFYARWNGTNLIFTDHTYLTPSPALPPVTN